MNTLNYIEKGMLLILFLFISACSKDDDVNQNLTPSGIETAEELTAYFENLIQVKNVPGFSVTIILENDIDFHQSYGYADITNQIPYTNHTINNMASVSKTFVGAATAKAISQGYFTLETSINDILPVDIINPKQPDIDIKIKHLITHTSGIVDVPSTYIASNYYILPGEDISTDIGSVLVNELGIQQMDQVDLDDYLLEIFNEDGTLYNLDNYLDATPGSVWAYSNDATSLMGFIIEYVSGQSFDDYVKNHILNPLQMSQSTFNIDEVDVSNLATQYYDIYTPFPRYGNHGYVEGGLYSSSDDMSNYLLDMMKGARGASSVLFSSDYYDLLFTPQLAEGIMPTSFAENHGLFWYMKNGNVMHGGNSLGVSTHIQFKQDGSSGFCIITNMDGTFVGNEAKWEEVKTLITQAIQQYISNN